MTKNSKEQAQELLEVLMNSKEHNPAWALQEVLVKLREHLAGTADNLDWRDECNSSYINGFDDCIVELNSIIEGLDDL
jgi:hypothetical protein